MSSIAERSFKRKSQGAIYGPNSLQLLLLANMYRKVACQLPRNCFQAINFIFPHCITRFPFFSSPDTDQTLEELTKNPSKSSRFCRCSIKKKKKCHRYYVSVLESRRRKYYKERNRFFICGLWWMQGGSIQCYNILKQKTAESECAEGGL